MLETGHPIQGFGALLHRWCLCRYALRVFMLMTVLLAGAMVSICLAGAEQLALDVETFSRSNNTDFVEENVRLFQTSANDTVSLNGAATNNPTAAAIAALSLDGKPISEEAHLQTQSRIDQSDRARVNRAMEELVLAQKRRVASGRFWPHKFALGTSSEIQGGVASSPVIPCVLFKEVGPDLTGESACTGVSSDEKRGGNLPQIPGKVEKALALEEQVREITANRWLRNAG